MQTRRKIASRAKPGGARFTASRTNRQTFIAGLGSFALTGQAAIFMRAAHSVGASSAAVGSPVLPAQGADQHRPLLVDIEQSAPSTSEATMTNAPSGASFFDAVRPLFRGKDRPLVAG